MIYLRIPLDFEVENFSVLDMALLISPLQARLCWLGHILEICMENCKLQWSFEAPVSYPLLK